MTRVVAILAHPDDAAILAGGTLYQHRQRGDSVEICSVTYTPESLHGQEGAAGARCNQQYAEGLRRLPLAFVNNLPAYEYLP